jgi:hypothetical protein
MKQKNVVMKLTVICNAVANKADSVSVFEK